MMMKRFNPIMIVLYMCTYLCYCSLTQLEYTILWRNLGPSWSLGYLWTPIFVTPKFKLVATAAFREDTLACPLNCQHIKLKEVLFSSRNCSLPPFLGLLSLIFFGPSPSKSKLRTKKMFQPLFLWKLLPVPSLDNRQVEKLQCITGEKSCPKNRAELLGLLKKQPRVYY